MTDPTSLSVSPQPVRSTPDKAAQVDTAIANAARRSTIDFDFLLTQAILESDLDPQARATGSSASGLYQFIESTWLSTMKRHGARFGLGDVSAKIRLDKGGGAFVADPAEKTAILALRTDPQIASFMAAGLAEDNRGHLTSSLGRAPDDSELYLAHFLGAEGATRFLTAMNADPDQSAASLFTGPAATNRAVFFAPNGDERSLAEVISLINRKMAAFAPSDMAAAPVSLPKAPIAASRLSLPPGLPEAKGSQPTISRVLAHRWETSGASALASPQSTLQVKRAYAQLSAIGF